MTHLYRLAAKFISAGGSLTLATFLNKLCTEAVWANVRVSVLSNKSKSFARRIVHDLLPTDTRLSTISRNSDGSCRFGCFGNPSGDLVHCLFLCQMSKEVGQWLFDIYKLNFPNACFSDILRMDLSDKDALTVLTVKTLEYIWYQRAASKRAILEECLSNISADLEILDLTKYHHISGEIKQLIRALD